MWALVAGVLVAGVLAGAVGAQVINFGPPRFLNTGLFLLQADEVANFHVALDDRTSGPPARVLLQLFTQNGTVVARKEAVLEPGQSTTLPFRTPGLYRAHAQILEPDIRLGPRRIVVSTLEILSFETTAVARAGALKAQIRYVCSASDGSDNGRLPD
jgi:hypothetical protein